MKRMLYALKQGWQYRHELKAFLIDPALQITALDQLTFRQLEAAHVAVVALDFDGVLAPHDSNQPLAIAEQCIQSLCMMIGEQRIAILTNKAKSERLTYFKSKFPGIQVVIGTAKKPYPDGLWEIANYRGIDSSRILLVDDRLLTGMLAACLAPCQARYFALPFKSYRQHLFKEIFFTSLRWLERRLIRLIG